MTALYRVVMPFTTSTMKFETPCDAIVVKKGRSLST
jgi:hypothetical protein